MKSVYSDGHISANSNNMDIIFDCLSENEEKINNVISKNDIDRMLVFLKFCIIPWIKILLKNK